MKNKIKILVVEDNEESLKVAKKCFNQKDVDVEYISYFNEAIEKLERKKRYDGIITDLFLPETRGERNFVVLKQVYFEIYNRLFEDFFEEKSRGRTGILDILYHKLEYCDELRKEIFLKNGNAPLGVLIARKAEEMNIPYVITTSLYHHDRLVEPVYYYCRLTLKNLEFEEGNRGKNSQENLKLTSEYWDRVFEKLSKKIIEGTHNT
jgi:CheY-like chemotaxis protein